MDDLNTADKILGWMERQAAEKIPADPLRWLEAAMKLEILSSDESDKLIDLEFEVAQTQQRALAETGAAAKARIVVEASEAYRDMRKQKGKMKRIEDMVMLAKKFATLKDADMNRTFTRGV